MGKLANAREKVVSYFKGVYHEMQRVVWPSRKKTISDSVTVIVFSAVVAALLAGCDFVFAWGLEQLINIFHK